MKKLKQCIVCSKTPVDSTLACSPKCRLLRKIEKKENGCWEWQGSLTNTGYGKFMIGKRFICSHRASYEIFVGKIPEKLQIMHLCDNKKCINPDHLKPGTAKENTRDHHRKYGSPKFRKFPFFSKHSEEVMQKVIVLRKNGESWRKISVSVNIPQTTAVSLYEKYMKVSQIIKDQEHGV